MKIDNSLQCSVDAIHGATVPQSSQTDVPPPEPDVMPELNQLACSGDPGAMLAALTMQSAKTQEKTSRAMRDQAMSAQEKADAAAVQDLRDKADLQRAQGIFDGVMQIGKGACDLASGLSSIGAESAKSDGNAKAQTKLEKVAAWTKFSSAACGATQAVGDGVFQGEITDKDADEKVHDASADTFKKMADDAHDSENDAKQLLNKALDFYKEYVDTKNQTAMAAIHRA